MIRVGEQQLEVVERSYRRNPLFFAYLYHDLLHEPEVTEPYINTAGGLVTGYILIYWRPRWCPAVHIVGNVDEIKLPKADCMRMHLESSVMIEIPRDVSQKQAITMTCGPECVEKAKEILASENHHVRRVAPEEYQEHHRVLRTETLEEYHSHFLFVDVEYLFSRCEVYGLYSDGRLASTAAVCVSLPEVWVISDVYTPPKFRGKGFATYLMAYLTREALSAGATPALSVIEENVPAIKMYRRIGYKAVRTFFLLTL